VLDVQFPMSDFSSVGSGVQGDILVRGGRHELPAV
jgi:hypothetical protein